MAQFVSELEIGKKIGNGHFGEVHLGDDPVLGEVAVKILHQKPGEPQSEWDDRRSGLLAEATSLKKADHKHVVQVHHVLETAAKDAIHLVMELCRGGSLQKPYEAGPISPAEVHKIATDVCHGLCALHDRGMIHRDIKPGNILIHQKGYAKLGDFGLVTDNLVLGYGSMAGYSDHLAYEFWHTSKTSAKTDIWALGMTLYRLLHGDSWYRDSPAPKHVVKDGGFADSLAWLPHISSRWRRLIRSMLNDDPNGRPKDAHKLLNQLSKLGSEADWSCECANPGLLWRRNKGTREIRVELRPVPKDKFVWRAVSLPLGAGNKKALAGSAAPAAWKATIRELTKYFETSS